MSIQANELRIGNYLYNDDTDDIMVVSRIESKEYTKWNNDNAYNITAFKITINDGYYEGDFRPIPLTEEWLFKFGFEVYKFDHKENQYRFKNRLIVIRDNLFCDYGTAIIINHVHQLQNLYYCLCGEELTIKL